MRFARSRATERPTPGRPLRETAHPDLAIGDITVFLFRPGPVAAESQLSRRNPTVRLLARMQSEVLRSH